MRNVQCVGAQEKIVLCDASLLSYLGITETNWPKLSSNIKLSPYWQILKFLFFSTLFFWWCMHMQCVFAYHVALIYAQSVCISLNFEGF